MRESGVNELFFLDPADFDLVEGENTLAIQGFNTSLESTDFHMDLSLNARVNVPVLEDSVGLTFSMASGFYEDSLTLEITPSDTSWYVTYTLDGSNPQASETAEISKGWPVSNVNGQAIDLRMDSRVVNSSAYKDLMIPALTDIPSISVISDLDHLLPMILRLPPL